ncbi:Dihydrodipicolinate synthase/N-acetylneuraminate lyase [Bryocella elongata]|uniref:Dihydrodipicolinate synthase/N-acetylneuraminate lyase n=1 Tax=Bryocella elongata TaxID=863522 RepID=A0A1H5U320_9BACT|nr:dihydrodipicolinate synthase family protein [Bryocella elongata]SEF69436.1 Dihydrodipicolinate synthase/N-acetylneuraminate lyase [Bryocella elongata]
MLISGIHVPLTAPFYLDQRSYLRKLEHNVRRYSLTPASALVAFAPGSEGDGLSDNEIAESLASIVECAAKEKVLVAGLPRTSVRSALAIAVQAEAAGFDAVLVSAPLDAASLKQEERLVWFRAIADGSPLPVMLYSDANIGATLSVAEAAALAHHPNVLGLYDAALTVDRFAAITAAAQIRRDVTVTTIFEPVTRRMLRVEPVQTNLVTIGEVGGTAVAVAPAAPAIKTRTRAVGFQIIAAGRITGAVELLQAGVPGLMPSLAASAPQGCHEVFAAFKDGDPALAALKAARLASVDDAATALGIAAIKYGCDLNGYYGGPPRLPRVPLTASDKELVERALGSVRN